MHRLIEEQQEAIVELCRRFHVQRLEVFGSAVTGAFDPAHSDIDFLVEFDPAAENSLADDYFDLLFALEKLFARGVDLVMSRALKNPYFIRSINQQRTLLYAA
jgi:predicted nucleotidyltransferase